MPFVPDSVETTIRELLVDVRRVDGEALRIVRIDADRKGGSQYRR